LHDHIVIETTDAIEIAEILEYLMARLNILAEHRLASVLFADCSPYGLVDLRADVQRLINNLLTSPIVTSAGP
jgi:hypothetical protein